MKNIILGLIVVWVCWRTYEASAKGVDLIDAWRHPFTPLDKLPSNPSAAFSSANPARLGRNESLYM
jgi:hypothetical protein